MTEISRRFESFIKSANKNLADKGIILPVKTDRGIEIGDVLIVSKDNLKYVYFRERVYGEIYLNSAAIKIANLLALHKNADLVDEIYRLDQEYGKWFVDNQYLLALEKEPKIVAITTGQTCYGLDIKKAEIEHRQLKPKWSD